MAPRKKTTLTCSFCGRTADEVAKIVTGPNVNICDECIETCQGIVGGDAEIGTVSTPGTHDIKLETLPTPHEMKAFLDNYVIGQDKAKITVSVAAYNHYKRLHSRTTSDDIEIEKSNILLLGPTGTGKTLIAQSLARLLHVPFAIVDATAFTEAGYVGEDVENMLVRLLSAADYDVEKTQRGIIYIDEFDKIGKKGGANPSITRDVSGEGVQQAMLKMLEGTEANVPPKGGRKHPEQKLITINTRDILFICGGAFVGLEEIIEKRTAKGGMGFTAKVSAEKTAEDAIFALCEPEDLVQYGLIPELIGRIPAITALEHLDKSMLLKILTEPKNAIVKQYHKLFEMEEAELTFTDDALDAVVKIALEKKTGARGLRNVLENALIHVMFDLPSRDDVVEVIINEKVITEKADPEYVTKR